MPIQTIVSPPAGFFNALLPLPPHRPVRCQIQSLFSSRYVPFAESPTSGSPGVIHLPDRRRFYHHYDGLPFTRVYFESSARAGHEKAERKKETAIHARTRQLTFFCCLHMNLQRTRLHLHEGYCIFLSCSGVSIGICSGSDFVLFALQGACNGNTKACYQLLFLVYAKERRPRTIHGEIYYRR